MKIETPFQVSGIACVLSLAVAGAAAAQPADLRLSYGFTTAGAPAVTPSQADPHARFVLRYVPAAASPVPGTVRTAVDREIASKGLTGSVGYLCGLRPSPNETNGPVSSFDSVGTFLGAKLSHAF